MSEGGLRRKADRVGWKLVKSRARNPDTPGYGLYALLDHDTGATVHPDGPNGIHVLDLDDVEEWLAD